MERLIADHGKPNHYQRILEAAFSKMGKLNKLNPANCEALTEKLGVIISMFTSIRIMEEYYTAKYVGDPAALQGILSTGFLPMDFVH